MSLWKRETGAETRNSRREAQAEARPSPDLRPADSGMKTLCVPSRTPCRRDAHAGDAGVTGRPSPAPCPLCTGKVVPRARVPVPWRFLPPVLGHVMTRSGCAAETGPLPLTTAHSVFLVCPPSPAPLGDELQCRGRAW